MAHSTCEAALPRLRPMRAMRHRNAPPGNPLRLLGRFLVDIVAAC